MASQINKFIGGELHQTNFGDFTNRHWLLTKAFWKKYKIFRRKADELIQPDQATIGANELVDQLKKVTMEFELVRLGQVKLTISDYDMSYKCIEFQLDKKDRLTLSLLGMSQKRLEKYASFDFQTIYIKYLERITHGQLRVTALYNNETKRVLDMFKLYEGDTNIGLITRVL